MGREQTTVTSTLKESSDPMSVMYARIKDGVYDNTVAYSKEARAQWQEAEAANTAKFRADLEAVYGVVGHAKAGRLWELAWDHGHSSGYSEVLHYYDDFVTLVK
jgi:hypothetical protein